MTLQFFIQVVLGFLICGVVVADEQQANANIRLRARVRRDAPAAADFEEIDFDFDGVDEIQWKDGDEGEAVHQFVGGEEATPGDYPYFGTFDCHIWRKLDHHLPKM